MKYKPAIVVAFFESEGLPAPVTEHKFHDERKWRFDFAWLDHKIALEVEGGIWIGGGHSRGSGVSKDIEKYNEATLCGWRIIRCVPKDVATVRVADMIKRLL